MQVENVGELAPLGRMHEDVVGGDQRRADFARQRRALRKSAAHVGAIGEARADPQAIGEGFAKLCEQPAFLHSPLAGEGG